MLRSSLHYALIFLFYFCLIATTTKRTSALVFTMPGDRNHVVVVGSANQDLTSYTPTVPVMGETVMGQEFETSCGGKGSNQAVAAGSLGISPVTMICRVGDDVFGEALLDKLASVNVAWDETRTILRGKDSPASGTATIVVDTNSGDNMIIVTPGANYALSPDDVEESLRALPEPPAIVVVQLEIKPATALQALRTAKDLGAITVLNPAPAPEGYTLDDFFPYVDILIPNETELRKCLGKDELSDEDEEALAKELLDKGMGMGVIVTLGARGAMVVAKKDTDSNDMEVSLVDAPRDLPARNEPIEDTIGAGDAFCGALSTYLSAGLSLTEAAGKACGVASMSVRRRGANYPTASELPETLKVKNVACSASAEIKPRLTFVTGNKNKLEEVKQILESGGELPFELSSRNIELPELQGEPYDIAIEKCRIAASKIKGPCLTEDTSLCFNALNGMPGPYIKWFLEKCGHDGLNAMLTGFDDKSAYAETIVAFTKGPDEDVHVFDGRTDGRIVPPRGLLDFGWDPIFEADESDGKTYAEMDKSTKNAISHRGRSLAKLRNFLLENRSTLSKSL
jgi:ribokinase/non-canonical purine NTP pyrophosphatase (RdgB/HAM1 family)